MDGNKPLRGVNIRLDGAKTVSMTTDTNGDYTFSDLPGGARYTITPAGGRMKFAPPTRSLPNLRKDESADFSGTIKDDQIQTKECTDADKARERKAIIDTYGAGWRRRIEGDPPRTSDAGLPRGQGKPTLGPIEYQFTFNECIGALITARYVWDVRANAITPPTTVAKQKRFVCFKVGGTWVCT
jgi:hypothetical protein